VKDSPSLARTIAIGDIHGCSNALGTIIATLAPEPDDTIVVLGDFIDRGVDTRGVIDQLIKLSSQCRLISIQGNHEQMMLDAMKDRTKLRTWIQYGESTLMSYGADATLESIPIEHLAFVRSTRDYFETASHLFVHATYVPNLPMEEHSTLFLRWESFEPARLSPHYSGKKVIVGHTRQESGEVCDIGFAACIDTGCYRGGWLTAMEVVSGQIWQVNEAGRFRTRAETNSG
jgi:serine/threonine protein phosphatase 1